MSGLLLLGVVLIYSKKVDYLRHDYRVVFINLRKAFTNLHLNLPEHAAQAPIHSITLPERFDLDALELDDYMYDDGHDYHLRSHEDITLTDQIPTGGDVYVAIPVDEVQPGVSPMEEDTLPPFQGIGHNETEVINETVDAQDPGASSPEEVPGPNPGASNQTGEQTATVDFSEPGPINETEVPNVGTTDYSSPQNVPDIKYPVHDICPGNIPPPFPEHVATEPVESVDQIFSNEKEIHSPIVPEMSFASLQFATHSTPPLLQQNPRRWKRKFFDESIVLSNAVIKKGLEDASDFSRKRRSMPNTALGLWKFNNFLRKEQVFQEPLLTRLSADICNIFYKDCISSKPHLVVLEDAITDPMIVDESAPETEAVPGDRIFQPPSHANEIIAESANGTTENVAETPSHITKDIAESPSLTTKNIAESSIAESSSPVTKTTVGTDALPTPDIAPFTGTHGSEFGTPKTPSEEQLDQGYTGPSDIPELANSVEAEDLNFLEADNSTPPGSHARASGSQGVDSLSVRSRAVAQKCFKFLACLYELSVLVNCIVLILKSRGFIDVQQEQPYGDITLSLTLLVLKVKRIYRRAFNSEKLFAQKKLHLVLDLNDTLLHTKAFKKLTPDELYLKEHADSDTSNGSLFVLDDCYLVKLRPFIRTFLKETNSMFEIYTCSMGARHYVKKVTEFLDPKGNYFDTKLISQEDFNLVLGQECGTVIVDDTNSVWSDHLDNLITVEKYNYFTDHNRNRKSYAEMKTDESESEGELLNVLGI
ncbi:hypothetical protein EZV62_023938 [Acer yangbiense]|uniref:FCP1 homology domain-containing protein n=1 Tax=Acer yangbiense TaxID=1000413 RepID=A0A5C7H360_9ROSI|nr:hypothetical protein EZV62_023938 [Acer yangbiense]